jgi:hypothetical protein
MRISLRILVRVTINVLSALCNAIYSCDSGRHAFSMLYSVY